MIPGLTICSFWTKDWSYEKHAVRLKSECIKLGLAHHIKELPSTGDYLANTRMKPRFVLYTMLELKTPLLWIDVDGSILKRPVDLRSDVDFMARRMPESRGRTWHVGTLFFNHTPAALELLRSWAAEATGDTDEYALEVAWRKGWDGTYDELPSTYFAIARRGRKLSDDVVICHRISRGKSKMQYKKAGWKATKVS